MKNKYMIVVLLGIIAIFLYLDKNNEINNLEYENKEKDFKIKNLEREKDKLQFENKNLRKDINETNEVIKSLKKSKNDRIEELYGDYVDIRASYNQLKYRGYERGDYESDIIIDGDRLYNLIGSSETYSMNVRYKLYDIDEVEKELYKMTNKFPDYEIDFFDCVDFSMETMVDMRRQFNGMAIGVAIIGNFKGYHAVNIIIDEEENVWYYDPQTRELFLFDEMREKTNYFMIDNIII
ncbi:MAG: hypothetical protein ACOCP8_04385 [archaeon]